MTDNKPKRQHTVASSILKKFTGPNGMFWVFDREKNEYREQHPNQTTVVKDFYTFTEESGEKSYALEEGLGKVLESRIPGIINKIDDFVPITEEEKAYIATFAALQKFKTTAYRKDHNRVMQDIYLSFARTIFGNESTAESAIKKLNEKKPADGKLKIGAKEMGEFVDALDTDNIIVPQENHLQMMLNLAKEISGVFLTLDWAFLRAPVDSSFVMSDNPFALVGPHSDYPFYGVGLLTPGAEKTLPLSPKTCLMMLNPGEKVINIEINKKLVRGINCRTVDHCDRYIISRDRRLLERLVKITRIDMEHRKPQFGVSTPHSRSVNRVSH